MKSFVKYEAAGNDFILFDESISFDPGSIQKLTHRQLGIGADGVIVLFPSETCDRRIEIYNPDGTKAQMCGNGLRACFQYLHDNVSLLDMSIQSPYAKHRGRWFDENIEVQMGPIATLQKVDPSTFFVHTGAPHLVRFVTNFDFSIADEARHLQKTYAHLGLFNVNFVKAGEKAEVRTYEKGVNAETLACGTGAVAAAAALQSTPHFSLVIYPKSNEPLRVNIKEKEAFLTGKAHRVFEGKVLLQEEKNLV